MQKELDELHLNLINARNHLTVAGEIMEENIRRVERMIFSNDEPLDQADYEHQQSAERSAKYAQEQ